MAAARALAAWLISLIRSAPHSDDGTWSSANDCDRARLFEPFAANEDGDLSRV
jgi:hypothetical protein